MEVELQMHEEGPKVKIYPDALKATLIKIPNWKTSGRKWHTQILVLKIHLHPRHTGYRNE